MSVYQVEEYYVSAKVKSKELALDFVCNYQNFGCAEARVEGDDLIVDGFDCESSAQSCFDDAVELGVIEG